MVCVGPPSRELLKPTAPDVGPGAHNYTPKAHAGRATPLVALLGVVSLVCFAVGLTRIDSAFAGRAYAAYGGIYIAASVVWVWAAEGQRPTGTDLGAALAVVGALVIIGFASRTN